MCLKGARYRWEGFWWHGCAVRCLRKLVLLHFLTLLRLRDIWGLQNTWMREEPRTFELKLMNQREKYFFL